MYLYVRFDCWLRLIDGIKNFEEYAHTEFKGIKIIDAIPTGSLMN